MADYWLNFDTDRGSLHFNALAVGDPANIQIYFTFAETRMIVVPDAENCMIVSSFIWTKLRNVSDRRTDGRTDRRTVNPCYYRGRHCEQCGRAVKID